MTYNIQFDQHFEAYYDALIMDDMLSVDKEADALFDLLYLESKAKLQAEAFSATPCPTQDIETRLDAYQARPSMIANAEAAEIIEAEIYSDINTYEFAKHLEFKSELLRQSKFTIHYTPIQIKAVIDWLDLKFEVDPKVCAFVHRPDARSHIKNFMTRQTGIRHFVQNDDCDITKDGTAFTIRLHDIGSLKDLRQTTDLLAKQYGAEYRKMTIVGIELALDFYNVPSNGLLGALHKSIRYSGASDNFRIYKDVVYRDEKGKPSLPLAPFVLLQHLNDDWCMGVNRKGSPLCYRLYPKTTDHNKQPLRLAEYRLRAEVTLMGEALYGIDDHIENLSSIIKHGFKHLAFTKLSKNATAKDKEDYRQSIKPFGMQQNVISKNRNKRKLPDAVATHGELNALVKKAVDNLVRKF